LICWLLVAVAVAEVVVQVVVVLAVLQKPRTTPLHQARVTASQLVLAVLALRQALSAAVLPDRRPASCWAVRD
jgi:hypothetical protein